MSQAWRNKISDEVAEKYQRQKIQQTKALKVRRYLEARKRDECGLEKPVDEVIAEGSALEHGTGSFN